MITDIKLASEKRSEELLLEDVDKRLDLLLANYERVTSNPRSMGYLRFLLRHYAKSPTPWRDCFPGDTLIESNKTEIPIKDLKPGMLVWSYSFDYDQFEMKEVSNVWISNKKSKLYKLNLDNGKSVEVTENHKFLTVNNKWTKVKDLSDGDKFKKVAFTFLDSIEDLLVEDEVWDIEVKDNHNFVVSDLIAHNCVKDNTKRFGPERVKGLCGVLKDTIRQNVYWRGKKGHSKVPDVGAPGVAIAYADKEAANPPWHGSNLSELDLGEMAVPDEICLILEDIGNQCDPYRVIVGLDSAPTPTAELESLLL